jgi:hypothetical protein
MRADREEELLDGAFGTESRDARPVLLASCSRATHQQMRFLGNAADAFPRKGKAGPMLKSAAGARETMMGRQRRVEQEDEMGGEIPLPGTRTSSLLKLSVRAFRCSF